MIIAAIRHALCAVLLTVPFAFLLSLPWIDLGLFRQVETATVGLHAASGLCGLLLGALALSGDREARAGLLHPSTLAFAAVAALSACLAPFSGDAPRMLHGLIRHGVGGLWFADVALLTAGYLATINWPVGVAYRWSAAAAGAAAVALTVLFLGRGDPAWVPYDFPGWLGISIPLAAVPLIALPRRAPFFTGLALLAAGLIVGRNSTAIVAVFAGIAGIALLKRYAGAFATERRGTILLACSLLIAVSTAAVYVSAPAIEKIDITFAKPKADDGIPSVDPRDHIALDLLPFGTVWSRSYMTRTVADDVFGSLSTFALGRGWGAFPQVYAEDWRDVPGRTFAQNSETSSRTFWDVHRKADFHSHNVYLEGALALGIGGAILTFAAFTSPVLAAGASTFGLAAGVAIFLSVSLSFWFFVSITAPFLALAFACLGVREQAADRGGLASWIAAGIAVCTGLCLLFFSGILYGVSYTEQQARYFAPMDWLMAPPCQPVAGYLAPDREVNTSLYRRFVEVGEEQQAPFVWFAQRMKTAINYVCIMRDMNERKPDPWTLSTSLELRYRMLVASGNFPPIVKGLGVDIKKWPDDIRDLLKMAPERTDAIIPYVSWLISQGDKAAALKALSEFAPDVKAGDPVGHWIKARTAELEGDSATHKREMAAALRGGIADFIPLRRSDVEPFLR